ncbi:MoeA N-terminal region -like protein [Glarea lozoyensis ATCC 20868]|uniref:MoeA N-terminal region-like protein n=1 Tax=Glarea lozoyensis (strain ATCC 20868 / MF5171) TaxID=1116229 RepID=S3D816_GLAL2|nr:MoeA N-terminal region -like protein [Glarea lozoyensis ATCC 20868]EPE33885.1 MoeA N-terminal region -like protein [Glarea lozoyensis ATCC 20868]
MAVSYLEAINLIEKEAAEISSSFAQNGESLPISQAVGRICRRRYTSSTKTPAFDTSTARGFAINSGYTQLSLDKKPVILRIIDSATDSHDRHSLSQDPSPTCVEIEMGSCFPDQDDSIEYDACVQTESITFASGPRANERYIQISRRVERFEKRKFAGSDFRTGDIIIQEGTKVETHHMLACSLLA